MASLVLCLPVAHAGGGLRVQHAGRSYVYEWGPGAAAGQLQFAAFFPDCQVGGPLWQGGRGGAGACGAQQLDAKRTPLRPRMRPPPRSTRCWR